jgi:predicted phage terminase large subunit-like protein
MLEKLLYSLVEGDGTWYKEKQGNFVTSSKQLADDVCEIGIKCGYRSILYRTKHNPKYSFNGIDTEKYHVFLTYTNKRDTIVGNEKYKQPYWVDYKGKVYCVNAHNGIFLIRHNGKCSWTGNSSQYQFVGIDEVVAIPENQAIYMLSRLRRLETNKHIPIRFRCASNPPTREQLSTGAWVKTRYVDPKTRKAGAVFIPAWMDDNPYLDKEEYRKSLANLDPITRAQLEKGDWEISARGRLFERQWFPLVNRVKDAIKKRIRYWDLAATEISKKNKDPDYTSGTLMCITDKNEYFIEHIIRFREKPATVEANILKWANLDGRDTCIWIEQEPGSSGKSVIDHYVRDVLPGFIIKGQQARENKITRSELLASKAEQGLVYMVKGKWNDEFLDELDVFPDGLHEDQVDSTSGAFSKLSNKSSVKIAFFG